MPNIDDLFKRPSGRSSSCAFRRFKLSLRDLVEMMPRRGIYLAPTTIMRGTGRSVPEFEKRGNRFARRGLLAGRRNQRRDQGLGRTGGRPPKLTDDDIEAAKAMLANPDIGVTQIAHRLGVSPATLYRYIPAARTANTTGG
jgi:Helix-turn-helix domain of resolvase